MNEGWAKLDRCRKPHYFRDKHSLCREWGSGNQDLDFDDEDKSPDSYCIRCRRRRSAELEAAKRPTDTETLHSFMLWYQTHYKKGASLTTLVEWLPMWNNRSSVKHHILKLAISGLVEKRRPEGMRAQWWAIEK